MSNGFCLPPVTRTQLRAPKGASLSSSQQPTLENRGLVPEWALVYRLARIYRLVRASTLAGELSFLLGFFGVMCQNSKPQPWFQGSSR